MTVDASNMIAVAENARQIWTDSLWSSVPTTIINGKLTKGFSATKGRREVTNGEVIIPALRRRKKHKD